MAIEISTPAEFMAIKDWTDRGTADEPLDIVITADLDFSEISDFTGQGDTALYANFDGQGHSIKNMVAFAGDFYLMPAIKDGSLSNLFIDNCHITADGYCYIINLSGNSSGNYITIKNNCTFVGSGLGGFVSVSMTLKQRVTHIGISGNFKMTSSITRVHAIMFAGNTNIENCYINVNLEAISDIKDFYIIHNYALNVYMYNTFVRAKISYSGSGNVYILSGSHYYCYAAAEIIGNFTGNVYPLGTVKASSFYDSDLLPNAAGNTEYGQPTENIKSVGWLRSQGWAI